MAETYLHFYTDSNKNTLSTLNVLQVESDTLSLNLENSIYFQIR